MPLLIRLSLFILTVGCLTLTPEKFACADDQNSVVEVTTHSGRHIRGFVDSNTDERELVLSLANRNTQVKAYVSWSNISVIHINGREISAAELEANLPGMKTDFELRPAFGGWTAEGIHQSQLVPPQERMPVELEPQVYQPEQPISPQRVASLQISATVANWDRDPERDGLLVEIQPLSDTGELVAVDGRLDCELIIQRKTWRGGEYVERLDDQFDVLERWSEPVRGERFSAYGMVIKLPYRTRHPESHLIVDSNALLHVRFNVPGQGVFEASDANVNLRPFSRIRDDFQLYRGRRYFPQERTRFPSGHRPFSSYR